MKEIRKNITVSLLFAFMIFVLSFFLYLNFSYMGETDKNVEDLIFANFIPLIILANLKILLVYLAVGLFIGFFTILLKIERKRNILKFNVFFWFMFWVRGVKLFPQLFKEQLYNKGAFLKYFQILITDYVPLVLIYLIFAAVIFAIALKNRRIPAFFVIILLSGLAVVRFKVTPVRVQDHSRPNVLIFATDSLRPQNISYNGYHRKTPNIDRLFEKGANFLNARSSLARTFSSWTSIFTSIFPPDHQIRHMFPSRKQVNQEWQTIVKVLNQNDYETAIISDFAGDIFARIDYGFQRLKTPHLTLQNLVKQRSLEIHYFLMGVIINPIGRTIFPEMWGMPMNVDPFYVTEYTKRAIKQAIVKKKPFFVAAFGSNNHFPYCSKYPYYKLYGNRSYFKKHKYCKDDMMKSYSGYSVPGDDLRQIVDLYDNAARLYDDNLGDILKFLEKCGVAGNTIVVVMSDHGESLYENGDGTGHGDHLRGKYCNNMTLGFYSPYETFGGLKVEETVRDIDIAPTLLDMLALKPPGSFKGKSLLPFMRGQPFGGLPVYMESGLWYSTAAPYIEDRIRIVYPGIKEILYIERKNGEVILKAEYEQRVIAAKHKAYQLNGFQYIYMPGEGKFREEFYIDEKPIDKEDIKDAEFLSFKEKMVALFADRFFIDDRGFIRENPLNIAEDAPAPAGDIVQFESSNTAM